MIKDTVKVSIFEYENNIRGNKTTHLGMYDFPAKPSKYDYIFHNDIKYVIDAIIFDCDYDYIEIMVYDTGEHKDD